MKSQLIKGINFFLKYNNRKLLLEKNLATRQWNIYAIKGHKANSVILAQNVNDTILDSVLMIIYNSMYVMKLMG
jgi:hypothetical protein